ncbi:MAG: lipid-A-disaccharide synthase [Sphingobacteriaceae bacterium]|nr:lipid-A-disaccharide synthase [Sphingobacteriaceae bacterium]
MKLFFIAGEPSGDLHASNCIKELQRMDNTLQFGFTGGPLMEAVCKTKPVIHISEMAFMGFVDVLKNIRTIKANFKKVKDAILQFKPDALVLVDYPGFNLRMAKWAAEQNINVYYYISPTVWAWKENRVEIIRKYTRKLFVILPFEKAFYAKHHIDVDFVGHPLLDAIEQKKKDLISKETFFANNKLSEKPIIAVLPGSRKQEIERMMQIMLNVKEGFNGYQFVIGASNNLSKDYYKGLEQKDIRVVFDQTYELMSYAIAGIIKSGTSTLESALYNLPQVVCYKAGGLSFAIAKQLVDIKYISLVNLILDKPAVKELVQTDLTSENIKTELDLILNNKEHRQAILNDYASLYDKLGGVGASKRLAEQLLNYLKLN